MKKYIKQIEKFSLNLSRVEVVIYEKNITDFTYYLTDSMHHPRYHKITTS